mgnify:FL=1
MKNEKKTMSCRVVSCRVVSFLLLGALLFNQSLSVSAAAPNTQTGEDGAAGCGGGYVKGTQQESDVTPTAQNFGYSGGAQKYEVKASGTYRLEVWGAQGGQARGDGSWMAYGGYGGYAKGEIDLAAGDTLYIYVGGKGNNGTFGDWAYGGYNGGGYGCNDTYNGWGAEDDDSEASGGGGGATHIALNTNRGVLSTYANYKDEVLIVAGGGGGASWSIQGGAGGGTNGGTWSGEYKSKWGGETGHTAWNYPTQSGGYAFGQEQNAYGIGESDGSGGGGGGWYGGYTSADGKGSAGTGGSGHTHKDMKNTSMSNGARGGHGYARVTPVKVYGTAGGATGYAAETYRLSLSQNPNVGIQVGNGMFLLRPHNANVTSDYINNASTKDTVSPDNVNLEYNDDSGTRTVKWNEPESNGTEYEFKAQTYVIDYTDPSGMKLIMDTEAN